MCKENSKYFFCSQKCYAILCTIQFICVYVYITVRTDRNKQLNSLTIFTAMKLFHTGSNILQLFRLMLGVFGIYGIYSIYVILPPYLVGGDVLRIFYFWGWGECARDFRAMEISLYCTSKNSRAKVTATGVQRNVL